MKNQKLLNFTHPNTKKQVTVVHDQIFTWFVSDAHKSTLIMGPGGALIPVVETPEEVERRYLEGESKNGKRK